MSMDDNRQQREYDKFSETSDGGTSVKVSQFNKLVTEEFDYIVATYPDTVTEVYTYKIGGSGGTTVATVTVVYTDDTKEFVSTVTKA